MFNMIWFKGKLAWTKTMNLLQRWLHLRSLMSLYDSYDKQLPTIQGDVHFDDDWVKTPLREPLLLLRMEIDILR